MIPSNIQLEDTVTRCIADTEKKATGKVIYIHPLRRYYVVEFRMKYGSFRECYNTRKFFQKLSEVPLTRGAYLKLPKGRPLPRRLRCTPRII